MRPHGGARVVDRGTYLRRLAEARLGLGRSSSCCQLTAVRSSTSQLVGGVPAAPCAHVGGAVAGLADLGPFAADAAANGKAPPRRAVKENFVNRVVERCGPAVVRVETEKAVTVPGLDADVFSFFFGIRPEAARRQRTVSGHGSGFCVDGAQGIIVTNAHVVQGADRLTASFAGRGEPMECEVLETDEAIDLAVIKTKERPKKPLPSMPLGHSETVRTGDWAIVLGNPFGLQNTCTLGIVSSMDRSTGETGFDWMRHPLMQTDAAVNQGNSGGPMLNEAGEVIGIISMRALFGEGIGFAIPIDSARSALPTLLQRKKVPRAYLGIKMSAGSKDGPRRSGGAVVDLVLPKSPAEAGGFQVDDEILEADGRKIRNFDEVQALVRSTQVGSKLRFKVRRNGQVVNVDVKTADIRHLREANAQNGGAGGGGKHRVIIMP